MIIESSIGQYPLLEVEILRFMTSYKEKKRRSVVRSDFSLVFVFGIYENHSYEQNQPTIYDSVSYMITFQ